MTTSREEFEKWAVLNGYTICRIDDDYEFAGTCCAYEGWRARGEEIEQQIADNSLPPLISERQKLLTMLTAAKTYYDRNMSVSQQIAEIEKVRDFCKLVIKACKDE